MAQFTSTLRLAGDGGDAAEPPSRGAPATRRSDGRGLAPDSRGVSQEIKTATENGVAPEIERPGPEVPVTQVPFVQLVMDNLDLVWRSVRRLGIPVSDADDVTQDVFLIAKDRMGQIHAGSERAFLLAVASRVAAHARRSTARRASAYGRFGAAPEVHSPSVESEAGRIEARDLLDRVLDAMPAHIRIVFVLFEFEDFSVGKIAETLEIPKGTAATRLRRARELFKEHAARLGNHHRGETND